MKPIVLATQSRYKIALFQRLGLDFEAVAPPFDETLEGQHSPDEWARILALGKAASLHPTHPEHLVIGADQILACGDVIFGKPGTIEDAVQQLLYLAGKTHQLHTGVAIVDSATGKARSAVVTSHVSLHKGLSPVFLKALVEAEESWDCAGGYKYESMGVLLMSHVETDDPNAIVGLPLMVLSQMLSEFGFLRERFEGWPENEAPQ